MPVVTVVKAGGDLTAAANRNLATLLGAKGPLTGWAQNLILKSDDGNLSAAGGIKIGGSAMTSTDYDEILLPGDSTDDSSSPQLVMLNTRYVRTDEAADQTLIIRFEST